jgi:hypothetical protein
LEIQISRLPHELHNIAILLGVRKYYFAFWADNIVGFTES